MPKLEGLDEDVVGIILVGAEGCSEAEGAPWLREATEQEKDLFISNCRNSIRGELGDKAADEFCYSDFAKDRVGRPYFLMAVLDHPETPLKAKDKATQYHRAIRLD